MKKQILHFAVLMIVLPGILVAQDPHFSQYFNNPLLLNPALAGNGIEHIRITAIYRNQWAGMGTPYTTQGFAVDKVVNRIGIGAAITRNGAGDESIRTLNFVGNLSYHLPLGAEKINTLSGGIQLGIMNKSFDPSKLTFDNQYNPDAGYDPNMSSGEDFTSTNVTRPDMNVGLAWQRGWLNKEIRFKPFLGLSYSHITKPDETFIVDVTKVHMKRTVYGGAGYLFNSGIELRPSVMLLKQGPSKETTFGTLVNYQFDNKNALQLGVYNRMQDAVIAYAGYQMNLLFVGMTYDINTSELSKSGRGNNAFEISLTYSPKAKKKKEPVVKAKEPRAPRPDDSALMTLKEAQIPAVTIPESLELLSVVTDKIYEPAETTAAPEPDIEKTPIPVIEAPVVIPTEAVVPVAVAVVAPVAAEAPVAVKDFDKDGVTDKDDECPYIKGNPNNKGCPDSDGDGVIDMKDDCPMESGPATNKGCPDPNKPIVKDNQQLVKKFDNILFATGLVKLTTDDIFDIIERAIDILYADKTTRVILSGHTDAEGNEYQNMILSQARIDVVRRYMIQQGIDAGRIESVAYGETMPLENNQTAEGKKLNRRVEINILVK